MRVHILSVCADGSTNYLHVGRSHLYPLRILDDLEVKFQLNLLIPRGFFYSLIWHSAKLIRVRIVGTTDQFRTWYYVRYSHAKKKTTFT